MHSAKRKHGRKSEVSLKAGPHRSWVRHPTVRALLSALLVLHPSRPALAWGERGHRIVNATAVENLPEPLRSYFRTWKAFLIEHASDPDLLGREDPMERPHHYTDVEAYDSFPFRNFQRQFVTQRLAPPPAGLPHGDSIWQIERHTLRLAEALRRHRWDDADHAALFLAHYAADLTQPLHTVINYDGQLTGQNEIHARFEVGLVNALPDGWELHPAPPVYEARLRARIFEEMIASFSYRNVIFASDNIAVAGRNYLDPQYALAFRNLTGLLVRKRLEAAASFVGSLWYTAWVRAGKPAMRSLPAQGVVGGVPLRSFP